MKFLGTLNVGIDQEEWLALYDKEGRVVDVNGDYVSNTLVAGTAHDGKPVIHGDLIVASQTESFRMEGDQIEITSMDQLNTPQCAAVLAKCELKLHGTFTPPPFDIEAIKVRTEELDPTSQTKADIYMLMLEVGKLNKEIHG